jgi:hypothetical protein
MQTGCKPDRPTNEQIPEAYQIFLEIICFRSEEPWVIFSNGAFVGRPETGMRYFDSSHDASTPILDHYTGVGEVLAVHELDRVIRRVEERYSSKTRDIVFPRRCQKQ